MEDKSKGLGDTIEKVVYIFGIKRVITYIKGSECQSCKKRKEFLNNKFPYNNGKEKK